jgi:D-alanyl-D-alanine carboxypeptidase
MSSRGGPIILSAWLIGAAALTPAAQAPARQAARPDRDRAAIQSHFEQWVDAAGVPGAALSVVWPDGRAESVAAGVADRSTGRPMPVDALMLAGSTGKTLFAAVALQLLDEGRLDLDARVASYIGDRPWLAGLPNASEMTVRHLMTHTSGLVRYETTPAFTSALVRSPDREWAPHEQLGFLAGTTPPFAAGKGWDYSDSNYILLGVVLERITGRPLYDEIRRRFLEPLALSGLVPSTSRRIPGLVPGYAGARDPLGLPDEVMRDGALVINPQFEWAGGGFATSAPGLARWGHELYRGRAISPAARVRMIDAAVPARLGPETLYGLGVIVRRATPAGVTWGHSGFFPGYLSELVHVPATGTTIAIQVNSSAPRRPGSRSPLGTALDLAAALARDGRE